MRAPPGTVPVAAVDGCRNRQAQGWAVIVSNGLGGKKCACARLGSRAQEVRRYQVRGVESCGKGPVSVRAIRDRRARSAGRGLDRHPVDRAGFEPAT